MPKLVGKKMYFKVEVSHFVIISQCFGKDLSTITSKLNASLESVDPIVK